MKVFSIKDDICRMRGFPKLDTRSIQVWRVLCVLVLLGILTAGLWPFHAPKNDVNWLSEGNGLFLGKHGSLVSASQLSAAAGTQPSDSCSIEIWLKPNRSDAKGVGMILAFYT